MLIVRLEDRPGTLAGLGEALGAAGVNIDGFFALAVGGAASVHLLVEDVAAARRAVEDAGLEVEAEREAIVVDAPDRPGELGSAARRIADAGANIEVAFATAAGKLAFGVDDPGKAREAI